MRVYERLFGAVKRDFRDPEFASIARRYLVMNAFDGAMTTLGLVIGAYLADEARPRVIISAGLGAALAMGISGASGAYMVERAERLRAVKRSATKSFEPPRTLVDKAYHQALFLALVDASAPFIASLFSLTPFFLSLGKLIAFESAIIISVVLTMTTLFVLGTYLGKVASESRLRHGLIMVLMGVIAFLLILLLPF